MDMTLLDKTTRPTFLRFLRFLRFPCLFRFLRPATSRTTAGLLFDLMSSDPKSILPFGVEDMSVNLTVRVTDTRFMTANPART